MTPTSGLDSTARERRESMERRAESAHSSRNVTELSPQERHKKFLEENGEWNRKVEESISRLEKAAETSTPGSARMREKA